MGHILTNNEKKLRILIDSEKCIFSLAIACSEVVSWLELALSVGGNILSWFKSAGS